MGVQARMRRWYGEAPRRLWLWLLIIGVAAVTALTIRAGDTRDQKHALASLPAEQRKLLFDNAMHELETLCQQPAGEGLERRCARQRKFVLDFEECDEACKELVASTRPRVRVR